MNKLPILVNFILDESGSMDDIKSSVISGFNEYIQTLTADKKSDYLFTLTTFNSGGIKTPYDAVSLIDVSKMEDKDYQPDQGTPLFDAIGKTILNIQEKVQEGQKVLVAIMTDGMENDSKTYNQSSIKALIDAHSKEGWTFAFMGANQDSYLTASKMGISRGNTMNWEATEEGSKGMLRSFGASNIAYAAAASDNTAFELFAKDQDKDLTK